MYTKIVEASIRDLRAMSIPIPAKGELAGVIREYVIGSELERLDNHHYPMGTSFLKSGVCGVAARAAASAQKETDPEKKELFEAIATVYQEINAYIARYAAAVLEAANGDARLLRIGNRLKALSERAPEHFDEALQLYYLMWKIRGWMSDIGRLDVHLRKWFEADLASGYLTEDGVLELLLCFWDMLNENGSGDTLVNLMLGGKNADGSDAGSRLSVLMLEATKRCARSEPHVNVRVHKNLHPDIYQAMLEIQLMGQGQATVYNDEVVIPGLIKFGVPEEMAYSYTNDGCTEIMLDGCSAIEFNHIDAVGVFELAFNNGNWAERTYRKKIKYYHKDGGEAFYTPDATPGFESGRPEDCSCFEEFYQKFLTQYKFQVRCKANMLKRTYEDRMAGAASSVVLNGTFDSVLESGKDILRGGLPFEAYMMFSGSIPTVADCLTAVKKIVFKQKKYSIPEIKEAIRVNYEGYEVMRRQLLAAPKFGNDIDEVDLLAADIAGHFCDWLDEFRRETGFAIMPALVGWQFMNEAHGIAATPDGRRYGDPIAEHYCATPGKAVNGPTAVLRSISKAKDVLARAIGVGAVHISLPRSLGTTQEAGLAVLKGINSAAVEGGLTMMNIAIYDADVLRKAQADPENYKDVIVRVWGYSARFVDLCEEMQNHIISRVS